MRRFSLMFVVSALVISVSTAALAGDGFDRFEAKDYKIAITLPAKFETVASKEGVYDLFVGFDKDKSMVFAAFGTKDRATTLEAVEKFLVEDVEVIDRTQEGDKDFSINVVVGKQKFETRDYVVALFIFAHPANPDWKVAIGIGALAEKWADLEPTLSKVMESLEFLE